MSEEEDDYLSDKFLQAASTASAAPKTYAQRRRETERLAAIKNEQNRTKSRRQRELEAREEGLKKSLIEKAQEEPPGSNKALAMMMKMGFKPGQSLGRTSDGDEPPSAATTSTLSVTDTDGDGVNGTLQPDPSPPVTTNLQHIVEPLPLNEWAGKKGIGLGKRAASPSAPERLAKMAKMAEASDHNAFRDRAREEYNDRRAEGRLAPAQRTCATLDERSGRTFNVLWLNPNHSDSFPEGLIELLDDPALTALLQRQRAGDTIEGRMRARMQADALQPLEAGLEDDEAEDQKPDRREALFSDEDVEEATQFLRLSAQDRLTLVLDYLRRKYYYCFWCGTQYNDEDDMQTNCPGSDEDAHD